MPEAPRQLTSGQRPTPCGRKSQGTEQTSRCRKAMGLPSRFVSCFVNRKVSRLEKKARDSQGRKEKSHQLAPCAKGGSPRAEPPQGIENPPAAVKPDLALLTSSYQPTLTHPGVLAAQEP